MKQETMSKGNAGRTRLVGCLKWRSHEQRHTVRNLTRRFLYAGRRNGSEGTAYRMYVMYGAVVAEKDKGCRPRLLVS